MTDGYGNSRQHSDRDNVVMLPTEDLVVGEPFARLASHEPPQAVWRLRASNHRKPGVVMGIIPLDVQRRCERRWAARFSADGIGRKTSGPERKSQQTAGPHKSKRKTHRVKAAVPRCSRKCCVGAGATSGLPHLRRRDRSRQQETVQDYSGCGTGMRFSNYLIFTNGYLPLLNLSDNSPTSLDGTVALLWCRLSGEKPCQYSIQCSSVGSLLMPFFSSA
jgi:hypothetical protein